MADYLIHFNPNHDPKTGRFDFTNGISKRQKYNGMKRSEYIKDMKSKYKAEGYSGYKSYKYARSAADQNQWETRQQNKSQEKIIKYKQKIDNILDKNGNNPNDVRIQKLAQKMIDEYKNASTLEFLLENDYKVGKMFARSMFDVLNGTPKYNKNLDMKAKASVLL